MHILDILSATVQELHRFFLSGMTILMLILYTLLAFWIYRQQLIKKAPLWKAAALILLIYVVFESALFLWVRFMRNFGFVVSYGPIFDEINYNLGRILPFSAALSHLIFTILLVIIALKERKAQNPT